MRVSASSRHSCPAASWKCPRIPGIRTLPTTGKRRRSGGRPTAPAAARLGDAILDVAAARFLRDGYAATSIEAVAREARVAKRTFYARFPDKAALFRAVVERLIATWHAASEPAFAPSDEIGAALERAGRTILDVALSPAALGLRRLIFAESARFPELVEALQQAGADGGAPRIAALLVPTEPTSPAALFAARQFMAMLLSEPLNRATISGTFPSAEQRGAWVAQTVRLFLHGWLDAQRGG